MTRTIDEQLAELRENGCEVDEGNLISGPFIPDGVVRIYEVATSNVLGTGRTLEDALDEYRWNKP